MASLTSLSDVNIPRLDGLGGNSVYGNFEATGDITGTNLVGNVSVSSPYISGTTIVSNGIDVTGNVECTSLTQTTPNIWIVKNRTNQVLVDYTATNLTTDTDVLKTGSMGSWFTIDTNGLVTNTSGTTLYLDVAWEIRYSNTTNTRGGWIQVSSGCSPYNALYQPFPAGAVAGMMVATNPTGATGVGMSCTLKVPNNETFRLVGQAVGTPTVTAAFLSFRVI